MTTGLVRLLKRIYDRLTFVRSRAELRTKVQPTSETYQKYLDAQLRRSLLKRKALLPARSRDFIDVIASVVDLPQCDILCVGCRNTAEIDYFKQKRPNSIIGIDLFSESPDILVMDMHAMTFSDNRFDLLYSSHSLEHTINAMQAISEFIRVTRNEGIVAIEVPVHYDTSHTGTDLIDFDSLENLYSTFSSHLRQVLWSEAYQANKYPGETGTDGIRTIMQITKA